MAGAASNGDAGGDCVDEVWQDPYAEKDDDYDDRRVYIDMLMDTNAGDELINHTFYIMSFNVMLQIGDRYFPNEIGIVKYDIRNGLRGRHHRFIDGGVTPEGYYAKCKAHSAETHQIPVSGFSEAHGQGLYGVARAKAFSSAMYGKRRGHAGQHIASLSTN